MHPETNVRRCTAIFLVAILGWFWGKTRSPTHSSKPACYNSLNSHGLSWDLSFLSTPSPVKMVSDINILGLGVRDQVLCGLVSTLIISGDRHILLANLSGIFNCQTGLEKRNSLTTSVISTYSALDVKGVKYFHVLEDHETHLPPTL